MLLNKPLYVFLCTLIFSSFIGSGCCSIPKVTLRLLELENNKYMNISMSEYYDVGYPMEKWADMELQQERNIPPLGVLIIDNNYLTEVSIPNVNSPKWRLVVQDTDSNKTNSLQLVPVFNNSRYTTELECSVALPLAVVVGARCVTPRNFSLHSDFHTNAVVWVEYTDNKQIIRSNTLEVHLFSDEIQRGIRVCPENKK